MSKAIDKKAAEQEQAIRDQLEALAAMPDDTIDTSDIPEMTDWTGAVRGRFYRPVKQQLTLRLDADIIDWFRHHTPDGKGYQSQINRALREYVAEESRKTG
jgi:uncharacterized protein (DUF4415 family)